MQKLSSENYKHVLVQLRDGESVEMPVDKGLMLMDYLTQDNAKTHIRLNDLNGNYLVVRTTDIIRVTPVKTLNLKDYL
jgi:hypothetical protein